MKWKECGRSYGPWPREKAVQGVAGRGAGFGPGWSRMQVMQRIRADKGRMGARSQDGDTWAVSGSTLPGLQNSHFLTNMGGGVAAPLLL